jgi:alpha-tubulin suppressor-like RCC1 family protein
MNKGTALTSGYAEAITTDGSTPLSNVLQASIWVNFACALVKGASANEVWCWGANGAQQLGQGDTTIRQYPTQVGGLTNPSKINISGSNNSAGGVACALDGGGVRCWGYNANGGIGDGNKNSPVSSPTSVVLASTAALGNVVDLVPGDSDTCALRGDQTLWCWGDYYGDVAANVGLTNIVGAGYVDSSKNARFYTSDGVYHVGSTTKAVDCGAL